MLHADTRHQTKSGGLGNLSSVYNLYDRKKDGLNVQRLMSARSPL